VPACWNSGNVSAGVGECDQHRLESLVLPAQCAEKSVVMPHPSPSPDDDRTVARLDVHGVAGSVCTPEE
jgi:hypothetical protein